VPQESEVGEGCFQNIALFTLKSGSNGGEDRP